MVSSEALKDFRCSENRHLSNLLPAARKSSLFTGVLPSTPPRHPAAKRLRFNGRARIRARSVRFERDVHAARRPHFPGTGHGNQPARPSFHPPPFPSASSVVERSGTPKPASTDDCAPDGRRRIRGSFLPPLPGWASFSSAIRWLAPPANFRFPFGTGRRPSAPDHRQPTINN